MPVRLRNIRAVARKEIYHLLRDFRSLYLAFFIPLFLILLFGYALSLDVNNIETVVVDQDRTDLSRDLILRLDASSYFEVKAFLPDAGKIPEYLDHGRAVMAIVIPPGWTEDLRADRETPLQVLFDGSDPNFANISRGYMQAFIEDYNRKLLVDYLDRAGMEKVNPPVDARIRVWFNEDLESRNFIVPGIIAVIIMIVGAMLTSLIIAREYENGTMETLLSIPVNAVEFLLGKSAPYFLIGLADMLIAVLMGQVLFGIVMKSGFLLMAAASSLYLFVALSLGLMISILTKSQLVANQVAVLVTYLPSLLLSDFVFPVENMPVALKAVTFIVPATYFIRILKGVFLQAVGFDYLWPSFAVLGLMFAILGSLTVLFLKKEGM
ncbi:MAG: ABC transporter permease [Syntrophales bacterium]|nr:ABC transporter permease [Syntrophales bacterium]MDD5233973.1 ABC transporter permease [Syntrophales bacterium]MDD5533337.1 ABC transporter permease [Syntrophales bacterium]